MGEISKKGQERRLKWYGHVMRRDEEYLVGDSDDDGYGGEKEGRPKVDGRWKCGLEGKGMSGKESQNMAAWSQLVRYIDQT